MTAQAWGYLAMMTAAIVISQFTGFPSSSLLVFGACGLAWTMWLVREPRPATAKQPPRSPSRKRTRTDSRLRDSDDDTRTERSRGRDVAITTCVGCSRQNEEDADYCVGCGRSLAATHCPKCSTANGPDATYCKRCGNLIGSSTDRGVPGAVKPSLDIRTNPQPKRAALKCFDCGNVTSFGSESCREFGLEFEYSGDMVSRAQ
jgi:Double zinc ribbon